MKKLLVFVLASVLAGEVFAQEDMHKHQPFDMLLGLNWGLGMTPNVSDFLGEIMAGGENFPEGDYASTADFGLTYDFYLFNWLSFNTGLLVHPSVYMRIEKNGTGGKDKGGLDDDEKDMGDDYDVATPVCLTIPLMAHVNIPKVEWLYVGIGLNLNIPLFSILEGLGKSGTEGFKGADDRDTKGDFFVGLPIDIGFDFIKPGRGGGRFFVRITPEFHKEGTPIPIGFIWQFYNWKL
jgi:hypothetical protein